MIDIEELKELLKTVELKSYENNENDKFFDPDCLRGWIATKVCDDISEGLKRWTPDNTINLIYKIHDDMVERFTKKEKDMNKDKPKKQIYIINGCAGVGKDTFVSMVDKVLKDEYNEQVMNYSSIEPIKEIAMQIGWTGEKTEKDRKFLSDLKDLLTGYCELSMNRMIDAVTEFVTSPKCENATMLFLHIREPNEIKRAANLFNAKTILIKNDKIKKVTSNHADKDVFNYEYDYVIHNDVAPEEINANKHFVELKDTAKMFIELTKDI